jgi:hypothetical protein
MRSYGKQIIKRNIERMQNSRVETRDAVIRTIDVPNRVALVRIQGSDKDIYARWAKAFSEVPEWLKEGNAVRVTHPEGNHGRVEIVGHGIFIPSTTSGGVVPITPTTEGDGIVSGAVVSQTVPDASMAVTVTTGTIRIDGVEYTLNTLRMGSGLPAMGSGDKMGAYSATVTIDAASATYFRYDLIVAGTDGAVHVVKGVDAAADPTMPALPAEHVRLAHILVHPNLTAVEGSDINAYWTEPVAGVLQISFGTNPMHGNSEDNPHFDSTCSITLTVRDQYGNAIGKAAPGYVIKFGFYMGNGDIVCGTTNFDEGSGEQTFYSTGGSLSMTYTRQGTYSGSYLANGESSPVFYASTFTTFEIQALSQTLQLMDDFDSVQH